MLRVLLVIFNFFKLKKTFIILSILILCFIGIGIINKHIDDNNKNNTDKIKQIMEWAYIEGQKDALEGDIRIKKLNDSTYVKTKSLWD